MGGACGGGGAGGGPGGGSGPIWATFSPGIFRFTATVGSGGKGTAPTANRLRLPPSSLTACTLASRSQRRVGSMVMGSPRSSGRLGFNVGRNSSLDREDVAARRAAGGRPGAGGAPPTPSPPPVGLLFR